MAAMAVAEVGGGRVVARLGGNIVGMAPIVVTARRLSNERGPIDEDLEAAARAPQSGGSPQLGVWKWGGCRCAATKQTMS